MKRTLVTVDPANTAPLGAALARAGLADPFDAIGERWMLVGASKPAPDGSLRDPFAPGTCGREWNLMTASWGGLGVLWNRPVVFAFVRPTRHSFGFMNASPRFAASFYPEPRRRALALCGSKSGRDTDKAAETGLDAFEPEPGAVALEGYSLVLVCRTLHRQDLDPEGFLDPAIHGHYDKDWHRLYVGQVESFIEAS